MKSSLERKEEFVQTAAVSAVESLCKNDLLCALEGGKLVKEFLASCLMKIQPNSQKYARRGYALALSCIPMSDVSSSQVIEGLIKATKIEVKQC